MSQRGVSKFHALRPPAISIKDYLQRVAKYAACSGECFVLALVYIDRIIQSNPTFVVNSLNIHRLLITSIMLAAKFFDDQVCASATHTTAHQRCVGWDVGQRCGSLCTHLSAMRVCALQYFNNAYYAKVGGVPCTEINSLEVEFLFLCNFALFVNTETYSQYYTELCNHAGNVGNVCTCSQGPRVPQLVIPSYPALSHPPAQLEGHVWYPLRSDDEPHKAVDLDEADLGMDGAHVRGGLAPHASVQHFNGAAAHYHPHAQQPPPAAYYYAQDGGQGMYNGGGYPPVGQPQGGQMPGVGMPMQGGVPGQAGGPQYYPTAPHPTHGGMSRPDTRSSSTTTNAGDAMLSSPQVGVM